MECTLYHPFRNYPHSINKKSRFKETHWKNCQSFRKLYVVEVNLNSHLHGNKSCALKVSGILLSITLSLSNVFSVALCLFKGFNQEDLFTKLPNESQNLDIREPIVFHCFSGNSDFIDNTHFVLTRIYTNLHPNHFHNYLVECIVGSYVKAQF